MEKNTKPKSIALTSTIVTRGAFILLFLVLGSGFMWSYRSYQGAKEQVSFLSSSQGQAEVARLEVDALLAKVGGLILLPQGEKPAVATIQDIDALVQSEAFYRGAKNGDKVIVYRDRAIIYDPVNNKLVNVGPVYLQNQEPAESPDVSAEALAEEEGIQAGPPQSSEAGLGGEGPFPPSPYSDEASEGHSDDAPFDNAQDKQDKPGEEEAESVEEEALVEEAPHKTVLGEAGNESDPDHVHLDE